MDDANAQTYDIIERDTVPAPAPRPNDSPEQRIAQLLKWLQPTDYLSPGNEFMKHLRSYVPGTGKWIHESAPFRAWAGLDDDNTTPSFTTTTTTTPTQTSAHHFLHVRGVAGSGKSVFSADTIRQLQETPTTTDTGPGHVVLFFFFRQIVDKNHTARYLVRDFAAQLLPHCPALVPSLTAVSREHAVRGNEMKMVWPVVVEALRARGDEGVKGRVFCVVDALDEMDDGDLEGMVERLVALGTPGEEEGRAGAAVRVMVTSRPLPHIERALGHPGVVRLRLDPALLSPDVARYVDSRMATLDPPLGDDKNELVRQSICERANGLFLQARLLADNLAEGMRDGRITEEALPDSLDRLPRTLRAVYEDMLKEHARRSGVTAEQQAKILMCVTHASRPLRLIELGSLLSRMLHVDLRRGKDLVRAGCGRLLELLEDETVSVIHHSFTEFLHDASRREDGNAFPVLEAEASHAMLAVLSLEYLDGCPRLDTTIDDRRTLTAMYPLNDFRSKEEKRRETIGIETRLNHPLASYAVDNLFFHINKVSCGTSANQLLAALGRHLAPDRPAFQTWAYMKWSGPLSASFNTLHLLTSATDGALIPTYVVDYFAKREPTLLDSRDWDGLTPLAYASQNGYADFVEMLLAKGADPTSGGNDGLTPLHRAAKKGHAAAVRLLLGVGVDPHIKTWPVFRFWNSSFDCYSNCDEEEAEIGRETALYHAFKGDDHEVVKAFLPFLPPDEVNLYFHRAGTVDNVKAILDTGEADVNCYLDGLTKLYCAAQAHNPDLVRLLLQHGADPNQRRENEVWGSDIGDRERGPTPLHGLAGVGNSRRIMTERDKKPAAECIRLLVEAGADVNATMGGGRYYGDELTPLHLAVQRIDDEFMCFYSDHADEFLAKLLLSAGANPNAKTATSQTPLHLANPESPRLLQTLVEHGADINALNAWGRTPLLEMIDQLSRHSSFTQVADVKGFRRLLKLGSDVHITDNNGDTVFHYLIRNMRFFYEPKRIIPFVDKLLLAGADLNKRNKKGNPPLCVYKSSDKDEEVLREMVDRGMDLNSFDEKGRTVLWGLASRPKTVEKFIRLGADPTRIDRDGRTLLHAVVDGGKGNRVDSLRFLTSVGVKADTVDKVGNTIIHAVLRGKDAKDHAREELQFLLRAGAPPLVRNARGQSALHVAGHLDMLEIVLTIPAFGDLDVNEPDVDGFTPLHYAVALGERAVWKLIKAGADPTVVTDGGLSPLHVAARDGKSGVLGLLLDQYRERNVLEKRVNLPGDGRMPIHYACRAGSPEAVWDLLRNGADARAQDEKGLSPLHALVETNAPLPHAGNIVGMLQLAGVDLNVEAEVLGEDGTTPRRFTPLDMAVERECWELVRRLIAHGAEPCESHRHSKHFALATDKERAAEEARKAQANVWSLGPSNALPQWRGRWAACPGSGMQLEKETRFIAGGQHILDLNPQNGDASEILRGVLEDGDYDTIKEYAELGGDILELGLRDHTLLQVLVQQGHTELLAYFRGKVDELEAQGCVQTGKGTRETLLATACKLERPSLYMVQMLVEELGVDVGVNAVYTAVDYYEAKLQGATALHILACGVAFWHVEALEYLLSKSPDIEARNEMGMTPLLAAIHGDNPCGPWREETVRVLLRHGANANATMVTTKDVWGGSSALEISNHPGVTKLLLENGASVEGCPGILTRAIREWMDPAIVKLLLDAGSDPNGLPFLQRKQNDNAEVEPRYALHEAARPTTLEDLAFDFNSRQQAIINLVLSHGADAYAPYRNGSFALQGIVEDRGLVHSFFLGVSQANCNRVGHHGRTLLASACIPIIPVGPDIRVGRPPYLERPPTVMPDVVHVLLNVEADPLIVDGEGRTPLHWLCTFRGTFDLSHRNAFVALTRDGPGALTARDKQGHTPLHLAFAAYADRSQASPFVIQHLLSAGADPTEPEPTTGNSALHYIARRLVGDDGEVAAAAALLRELAGRLDTNVRNAAGETPVFAFAAVVGAKGEALDVFIDLGADFQVVDVRRRTLLHAAAEGGHKWGWDLEGLFKRLMELGVDPRAEDEALRTAIDVAVARDLRHVVMLFTEEGKKEAEDREARRKQAETDDESKSDSNSDSDSEEEDDLNVWSRF
jgi:ankyrin repeat protein